MESKQMKYPNSSMFTPWNDEQEHAIYNRIAMREGEGEKKTKMATLRKKKTINIEHQIQEDNIEDKAKKTLLEIGQKDKTQNLKHLQQYLVRKSRVKEEQEEGKEFKLPVIHQHNRDQPEYGDRKAIRNSRSLVMPQKKSIDNQEQGIFKKYGEHRKGPVERTISYAASHNNHMPVKETEKKYSTIESNRQHHEFSPQLKDLKLRGKKYSYDKRNRSSGKNDDDISYLPSQPNITPLYLLFGQQKKEVFRKVFQQIQHRLK